MTPHSHSTVIASIISCGAFLAVSACYLTGCSAAQQSALVKFNTAAAARLEADAKVAASAAAAGAAAETASELQDSGKLDTGAIGAAAAAQAVSALVNLDIARAAAADGNP